MFDTGDGFRAVHGLSAARLGDSLGRVPDDEFRGGVFELTGTSVRSAQPLFAHQGEATAKLERNTGGSGAIRLLTGAGKARVAIDVLSKRLRVDSHERAIWAIYPRALVRQGMFRQATDSYSRLHEGARLEHRGANKRLELMTRGSQVRTSADRFGRIPEVNLGRG